MINAKTKISGASQICVLTEAAPGSSSDLVPRLNRVQVIPAENAPRVERANDERSSASRAPIASKSPNVVQDPFNDRNSNESATAEIMSEHPILNKSRPQTPRPIDDNTEAAILLLVKQVLQDCTTKLKTFVRTKERVFGEAETLAVLKKYVTTFGDDNKLFRVGSALYRCTSQKSDFNVLISSSKNDVSLVSHLVEQIYR